MAHVRRVIAYLLAMLTTLVVLSSTATAVPAPVTATATSATTSLIVRAKGATGEEILQVRLDDGVVAEHEVTTEWGGYAIDVPAATAIGSVAVGFVNNLHATGDRNISVDHVRLGDVTHEAEDPSVYSTGHWTASTGCTAAHGGTGQLLCGGFLHFGGVPSGSVVEIFAVGSTGTENLEVRIGGSTRATERVRLVGSVWSSSSAVAKHVYHHPTPLTTDDIEIAFVNDGTHNGKDRNLRVDKIEVDGRVIQSEDPLVESKGAWGNGARCSVGHFLVETLACNGWFRYPAPAEGPTTPPPSPPAPTPTPAPTPPPTPPAPTPTPNPPAPREGSELVVWARGAVGTEIVELQIDGRRVATFALSRTGTGYGYTHDEPVSADQVRVAFVNDAYDAGRDRNVWVDRVEIDGLRYDSEHPTVRSKGTWANGSRCREGTFNTELLACNGWFQYASHSGGTPPPPSSTEPVPEAPALDVTTLADGLTNPWGLAFLPDGSLLLTERLGRFRIVRPDGELVTVAASFDHLGFGTSGLLGLAIDSNFRANNRFYTCQGATNPDTMTIVAWELAADRSTATRVDTVLSEPRLAAHSGCRLRVDADGWLWATMGDDYVADNPQDTSVVHGKVLRIDPFLGTPHPDNPDLGPGADRRIFSYGHRNPQGLAFEPTTGDAWISDHGPNIDDEVNRLVAGGNYGWNPIGPPDASGRTTYDEIDRSTTDPAIVGAVEAWWSSGSPTLAPGGIAFVDDPAWGDIAGALAMTTLKDSKLRFLLFNDAGAYSGQVIASELDGTYGRLRSPIVGPDGALYVSTSNSGHGDDDRRLDRILRVAPAGLTPPSPPPPTTTPPTTTPTPPPPPTTPAPTSGTEIVVWARGATGSELIQLRIGGTAVAAFELTSALAAYRYQHPTTVTADQVRVAFINDSIAGGRDRNAWIEGVDIGGVRFDSDHPSVVSRGTWGNGARCGEGRFATTLLACNGWFQYSPAAAR